MESTFTIVLQSVRHSVCPGNTTPIPPARIDSGVLEMAARHRVLPQLGRWIKDHDIALDADVRERLNRELRAIAVRNVRLGCLEEQVLSAFDAGGIRACPVKGLSLQREAYAAENFRQFDDLDFIVLPDDMDAVPKVLSDMGLIRECPMDDRHLKRWLAYGGEVTFRDAVTRFRVDCSSQAGHRYMARGVPQVSSDPGCALIISPEEMLLYLVVHGLKHTWCRLIWLQDLALFIHKHANLPVPEMQRRYRSAGRARAVSDAMRLLQKVLGFELPMGWEALLVDDGHREKRLQAFVNALESDKVYENSPLRTRLRLHLGSCERISDRMYYLGHLLFSASPSDLNAISLPPGTGWVYPILRPWRLMWRYLR